MATRDGQDVVAAITGHPATARFVCGRLYAFFVDDTPHEATVDELAAVFRSSGGDIRATLRALLLSARFLDPAVRRTRVKSPVELVVGLARTASTWELPDHRLGRLVEAGALMGQRLLAPPNVGGWPAGAAWLQGSNLLERVNHAASVVGGSRRLADAVVAAAPEADAAGLVEACLRVLDVDHLSAESHERLLDAVGRLVASTPPDRRVVPALQLVVALPEFQYC